MAQEGFEAGFGSDMFVFSTSVVVSTDGREDDEEPNTYETAKASRASEMFVGVENHYSDVATAFEM